MKPNSCAIIARSGDRSGLALLPGGEGVDAAGGRFLAGVPGVGVAELEAHALSSHPAVAVPLVLGLQVARSVQPLVRLNLGAADDGGSDAGLP